MVLGEEILDSKVWFELELEFKSGVEPEWDCGVR